MYKYYYTRAIVDNAYDIDNPARLDIDGNQVLLASEIETEFPTYKSAVYGMDDQATVVFYDHELSVAEKQVLDTIVYNHKNNL